MSDYLNELKRIESALDSPEVAEGINRTAAAMGFSVSYVADSVRRIAELANDLEGKRKATMEDLKAALEAKS